MVRPRAGTYCLLLEWLLLGCSNPSSVKQPAAAVQPPAVAVQPPAVPDQALRDLDRGKLFQRLCDVPVQTEITDKQNRRWCDHCFDGSSNPGEHLTLEATYFGHFLAQDSDDALLSTSGCEPHSSNYGGTALFSRSSQSGWVERGYAPGLITKSCRSITREAAATILVCYAEYMAQGEINRDLISVAFVLDAGGTVEFRESVILRLNDNTGYYGCRAGAISTTQPRWHLQESNRHTAPELIVEFSYGKALADVLGCTESNPSPPRLALQPYQIRFLLEDSGEPRFVPASTSRVVLEQIQGEKKLWASGKFDPLSRVQHEATQTRQAPKTVFEEPINPPHSDEVKEMQLLLRNLGFCTCSTAQLDALTKTAMDRFGATSLYPGPTFHDLLNNLKVASRRTKPDDRCRLEFDLLGGNQVAVLGGCNASVTTSTVEAFHRRARSVLQSEIKLGKVESFSLSLRPSELNEFGRELLIVRTEWYTHSPSR